MMDKAEIITVLKDLKEKASAVDRLMTEMPEQDKDDGTRDCHTKVINFKKCVEIALATMTTT